MTELETAFSYSSGLFLSFCVLIIILLLRPVFIRRRCECEICVAYLTSSWSDQFVNRSDWIADLLNRSPTKTVHIHVINNTITANPRNVEYMLKTKFHNFPKGKPFSTILGDFLGNGIFNADGDTWRFQRSLARLELDRRSARSFAFDVVRTEIEERLVPILAKAVKNRAAIDLQEVFRGFAFDAVIRFSFGLETPSPPENFSSAFDTASRISAERAVSPSRLVWKIKRFFNVGSERKLREAIRVVHSLAREVIAQKRKLGFHNREDLLSRFMESVENDDAFLRDIVVSFLLAGRDTVASALTGFFFLVARSPETESMIRAESDRVLGPSRVAMKSFDESKELHYLQAAIYESMRLLPPIQFDSKFCLTDDVLPDGTEVKSGTRVTYHPYAMGRAEEIWGPDWADFRPNRWLQSGAPVNPYKYPVFQAGIRVCLGKDMAMVELKSVALALIRRFRFELVDPVQSQNVTPRFSPGLTATFCGGLQVLVKESRDD